MDKFEHLSWMFNKRTKGKKYENFIVNAIYNRVGNFELIPITQQYVRSTIKERKYYLMDLYFPQINYGIEVDEMQHTKKYHIISDEERDEAIKKAIGCEERRIELYHKVESGDAKMRSFDDINSQINKYVDEIKELIQQKEISGDKIFWQSNEDRKEIVINKNKEFCINDDVSYQGVVELYNILKGCNRKTLWGQSTFKLSNGYRIWVPHLAVIDENGKVWCRNGWQNELSNDREWITETDTDNKLKETPARDYEEKRVVFMKMRDKYGKMCCRFIGVYQLYKSERNSKGNIVRDYKRKATNIPIAELLK